MIRIPKTTTIIGELRCDGATRVDARIEGEGNINGVLLISDSCVWVGKIIADSVIVEGTIEGHVIARKKLQITSKAKITGKIAAPEMNIEEGAILNCEVAVSIADKPVESIKPILDQNTETVTMDELAERRSSIQKTA